ncbi:MAG: S8/S53 family peptidase [Clostridia bacterium]|nr:S8/S53 family peptidase [Clostridia bacterium]
MKKLFAILISLVMIIACVPMAFARAPKSALDFVEEARAMMDESKMTRVREEASYRLNDPYQTGRILVLPGKTLDGKFRKAAEDCASFRGLYLLQYGTEKATKAAYKALEATYGEDAVILDEVFRVALPKAQAVQTTANTGYMSWGVQNMGMDKVKNKLKARGNKTPVTVAVLDTGISFFDGVFANRISGAFDMVAFNPVPYDFNGHGTHCAGTIVEATPENVKVMPVKTITAIGFGSVLNVLLGLLYADAMGADIVNMSLAGEDTLGLQAYDGLLKQLYDHGITTVVAAGNEAHNVSKSYPSSSKYVITVGATKSNNRVDRSYSNYGAKIDIVAPGTNVTGHSTVLGIPQPLKMTGTSMAAPHVSAACALIKCVYPNYNQKQVYNVLKRYAVDIEAKGKDNYAGWGRIDLTNFARNL